MTEHQTAEDTSGGERDGPDRRGGGNAAPRLGFRAGVLLALTGLREPVVMVLLLIAFFTAISGRPVNGALLLAVAASLAWDAARTRRRAQAETGAAAGGPALTGAAGHQPGAAPLAETGVVPGGKHRPLDRHRPLFVLAGLAAGALYAAGAGSFSRYSWPATAAVIGLGVAVIVTGWRGPLRSRRIPARLPVLGSVLWAGVLVAGGVWELASLFQQSSLTTDSVAHPTISALTDPLLASHLGRSIAIALWLGIGWFLVER